MSLAMWILLGVVVWVALGLVVAALVGGMAEQRDRHVAARPRREERGPRSIDDNPAACAAERAGPPVPSSPPPSHPRRHGRQSGCDDETATDEGPDHGGHQD